MYIQKLLVSIDLLNFVKFNDHRNVFYKYMYNYKLHKR